MKKTPIPFSSLFSFVPFRPSLPASAAGIIALSTAIADVTITVPASSMGGLYTRLEEGQAATRAGVFAGNFHQPGGGGGSVVAHANLFTGQPTYAVPLHVIDAGGGASFAFVPSFSGPTFPTVANDNDKAPAGWIGTGWSMTTPFVAVNHKGTRAYSDDVIRCALGPLGGGQILREPETGRYYVSSAPSLIVSRDTVSDPGSPLYRQIVSWTVTEPATGVRYVFGHPGATAPGNAHRHMRHAGGAIVAGPDQGAAARPFVYRWDVSRIEAASGETGLDFEYESFAEPLGGGASYIRESHLKTVARRDRHGNDIERVTLELAALDPDEYVGYAPGAAKTAQKPYETRRLAALAVAREGVPLVRYVFRRGLRFFPHAKKGVLESIVPLFGPEQRPGSGWSFTYRGGDLALAEIVTPAGARERFEYRTLDLSATAAGREAGHVFTDTAGNLISATNDGDGWSLEANCDDRFCYEIIRTRAGSPNRAYVRVTHNTGNYFDTAVTAYQAILPAPQQDPIPWKLVPLGDHFLQINTKDGTVDLFQWDGATFRNIDSTVGDAGDPIRSDYGGEIEVIAGSGHYFIVHEHGGANKRLWVYLRDPATGSWRNLSTGNRGDASCGFDNPPHGGYDPRGSHGYCFEWRWDLLVAANSRMFAVSTRQNDLLYLFALNAQGTGFDDIGSLIPFLPDTMQQKHLGAEVPQNWNYDIHDLRMTDDLLMIKSANQAGNRSRYDFLRYDGATVRRVAKLGFEKDRLNHAFNAAAGTGHDRNVWLAGDYFIHANTKSDAAARRVEYWRRRQNDDSVFFERAAVLRTDVEDEADGDLRIATGARHVAVEYYPAGTFERGLHPVGYPRHAGGALKSWLYRIDDTAGIALVPQALYTRDWEGCPRTIWNMSFSPLDDVLLATTHKNTGFGNCDCTDDCKVQNVSARLNLLPAALTLDPIADPIQSAGHQSRMRDRSWSLGNRLGLAMFIKHQSGLDPILLRRYVYDGRRFDGPVTADVVARFVRDATPDGLHPADVTEFDFAAGGVTEFNHNALTPHFGRVRVTRRGAPGAVIQDFHLDAQGTRLQRDSAGLAGRVLRTTIVNAAGDTVSGTDVVHAVPYARGWLAPGIRDPSIADPWPRGVAVSRVAATRTVARADNGSRRGAETRYHAYADSLEAPLIVVADRGDRLDVSQSLPEPDGARIRARLAFDYPDSAAFTESWFAARRNAILPVVPGRGMNAVAHEAWEHDAVHPYRIVRTFGWRDHGGSWSDAELRAGPVPVLDPFTGLFVSGTVTRRDTEGRVLEHRTEDGSDTIHAATFREGRAGLPVGRIAARRANTGVLTAENGNIPQLLALGKLDHEGEWSGPGVTYDSLRPHTGRYAFKVTDHFGPTRNLELRSVRGRGFGYIVSVWAYGVSSAVPPVVAVIRRRAGGTEVDRVYAAPVDGTYEPGRWQRWEARLSHGDLIAGGFFQDGSGDLLRVFVGTHADGPRGDSGRVIFVDDLVLRPDDAPFELTAYDVRGRPTHVTDTRHRTRRYEYGFAGQSVAERDERGRIFGQTGRNRLGENLE